MEANELARLLGPDWASAGGDRRGENLARRVGLALRTLITSGLLAPGARLPSERQLAAALSVSRPTITAAIDELKSQGLVSSRQGSGTWVTPREHVSITVPTMAEVVLIDRGINLAAATPPDPSHLGPLTIDLGDLMSVTPGHGYDPLGISTLRTRIAARYKLLGVSSTPEQILVTPGAHGALALCLGALVGTNERVIVESHTYGGILDLLSKHNVVPVAVRRDQHGIVPDDLDRLITRNRARIVYMMPSVHAPTGATTSLLRLSELATVLDHHEMVVICDEALAELTLDGTDPPRLAGLCNTASVIDVGSLSKIAWGGLRIGWIRSPDELRTTLVHHRSHLELGSSAPSQLLAMQIFDRLGELRESRRVFLGEKASMLQALIAQTLPDWTVHRPAGGLCLWVRLPTPDARPFVLAAAQQGVAVMAGSTATPGHGPDPHVRICFDRTTNELEEGTKRLGLAWRSDEAGSRARMKSW